MFESLHAPTDLGSARARLQAVVDAAGGRAIRLPTPEPADFEWPPVGGAVADDTAAELIVADTVLWSATWLQIRNLGATVDGGRVLHFLEPTAEVGWRRAAHWAGRSAWPGLVGHHFERDVPADLRAAGLVVTEMTRFSTGPGQLWSYVIGRAERI